MRLRKNMPFLLPALFVLAAGCVTAPPSLPPSAVTLKAAPGQPVEVDPRRLQAHVNALTGTSQPRNAQNVAALEEAAAYIAREFAAAGFPVYEQRFAVQGRTYKNLIVRYGPETAPRVVVGAHYDVAGSGPGADDNASGVAGLIELVRLVGQRRPPLGYRFEFVAYTLEEPPHFGETTMGSAVHARTLRNEGAPVRLMMSLEMIGYFSDQPGSQRMPPAPFRRGSFPNTGNFIAVIGRTGGEDPTAFVAQAMRAGSDIPVEPVNASMVLAGLSDQLNYWRQGYPGVMITDTSFFRNPHYHKATDTPDRLDYTRMAEVVEGLYYVLLAL